LSDHCLQQQLTLIADDGTLPRKSQSMSPFQSTSAIIRPIATSHSQMYRSRTQASTHWHFSKLQRVSWSSLQTVVRWRSISTLLRGNLCDVLDLLGKSAFTPVKNDLAGNVAVSIPIFELSGIFMNLVQPTRKSVHVTMQLQPNPLPSNNLS
jgi:hypothetical protein